MYILCILYINYVYYVYIICILCVMYIMCYVGDFEGGRAAAVCATSELDAPVAGKLHKIHKDGYLKQLSLELEFV
jgi:hypothetical protein